MDIRQIVISEFQAVFDRHGYTTPQEFLRVAETPFNLASVQQAVDRDIERIRIETRFRTGPESAIRILLREQHHEEELRKLSRQYAIGILEYVRRGQSINESLALSEQRSLKEQASVSCDAYPCARQQSGGL